MSEEKPKSLSPKSQDPLAQEVWDKMLASLEDKLQFGFLQHAREVTDVRIAEEPSGACIMTLFVRTPEAYEFFTADVNQQRLLIVSREFHSIDKFSIQKSSSTE